MLLEIMLCSLLRKRNCRHRQRSSFRAGDAGDRPRPQARRRAIMAPMSLQHRLAKPIRGSGFESARRGRTAWIGWAVVLAILVLLLAWFAAARQASIDAAFAAPVSVPDRLHTFITIFLGIFIEAAPFLLAGALASGFVEVFVRPEALARLIPRHPVLGALAGAALGIVLPVCECGIVVVVRRLLAKGLPLRVGVAFLLAAPVVNPIVFASTLTAFGAGRMLLAPLRSQLRLRLPHRPPVRDRAARPGAAREAGARPRPRPPPPPPPRPPSPSSSP